ncbi:MAG: radical SAM protein [Nitriliruptoraceae bacterium]
MHQLSHYTITGERTDGTVVYANTRSNRRVLVSAEHHESLQRSGPIGANGALPADLVAGLSAAGILVPHGTDELSLVAADYLEDREPDDELLLTLAPTISCNLACTYCFEPDHRAVFMTREEEARLLRFVRGKLQGRRQLHVVWFGGEPLLHPDAITRLSRDLLRIASFAGATYSAEIVTNGTRLTDELAAKLAALRVTSAQITIDGPAPVHDLLRPTLGGKPSYAATIAGALAAHRHMTAYLRMNLDRHNVATIPQLLTDLVDRGLAGAPVGFTRVEPPAVYGPVLRGLVQEHYLTVPEFAEVEVELLEAARAAGLRAEVPGFRADDAAADDDALPCAAVNRGHFVIEPGGKVKRCWAEVSDDQHLAGQLRDDGMVLGERDGVWREYDPIDADCASCKVLPICYGGCPKARIDGAMAQAGSRDEARIFKERYVCSPRRYNLGQLLGRDLIG